MSVTSTAAVGTAAASASALTFDTETTGLPTRRHYSLPNYSDLSAYNTCRMVSISWVCNSPEPTPIYYIVKPDGFVSSPESLAIHGITHEHAMEVGVPFDAIMTHLFSDIRSRKITRLVAHNLDFDYKVLCSELLRRGMPERIAELGALQRYCTMLEGRKRIGMQKYPKLAELYKFLTNGDEITHAHNAMYDTLHCYKCYSMLTAQ